MTVAFELAGQGIRRVEWRTSFQIHGGNTVCRELRDAGRSGLLMGEIIRGRNESRMRLAKRQIWVVVANRSDDLARDAAGRGSGKIAKSDESDASNEEA